MNVPFVDIGKQYTEIKHELDPLLQNIFETSQFILGKNVEEFEKDFAKYCGMEHCVGVSSGTEALHLALLAHDVGIGDEVIVPTNSFFASAEAIAHAGAIPVFVDMDDYYCIDVSKIEEVITEKTKAIMPVHLYGQCADMQPILEIAERKSLTVIEDSAQAHGAEYHGKKAGSLGDSSCFSFYPAKNLGAFGEGGAFLTNDADIADTVRVLRAHGEKPKNTHLRIGYNYRMEGIQGVVLKIKLKFLDQWNAVRIQRAEEYTQKLDTLLDVPKKRENNKHVYHLYIVQTDNRDRVREKLSEKGIQTGIHYPVPIHKQPVFGVQNLSFPKAEAAADRMFTLPLYPHMSKEEVSYTCDMVAEVLQ